VVALKVSKNSGYQAGVYYDTSEPQHTHNFHTACIVVLAVCRRCVVALKVPKNSGYYDTSEQC
jgi:hypothetical protein